MPASERKTITKDNLWEVISSLQGEEFYTAKKLPFTYSIKGGEFFTEKIQEDKEHKIVGPKTLNCFGAPYVWAVFKTLGIVS